MNDKVYSLMANDKWLDALKEVKSDAGPFTVDKAVIGATIAERFGLVDEEFDLISKGLEIDNRNYRLFYMLGNYYLRENIDMAYLCYQNALYHSQCLGGDENDISIIQDALDDLRNEVTVRDVSIVILSYNTFSYTKKCIESIRASTGDYKEIIVIDNGSVDESLQWLRMQKDIILIENNENLGFSKGCNQAINASCKNNDILLLYSDTFLLDNSLFYLRLGLYGDQNNGAAGSVTILAGNDHVIEGISVDQEKYDKLLKTPCEEKPYLLESSLIIKRSVLDEIGLFDERFTDGDFEYDDIGLRILKAKYKNVLVWNSVVCRYGSNHCSDISEKDKKAFIDKWGFNSRYFCWSRSDLVEMIDAQYDDKICVLEIGCGLGNTLSRIKYLYKNAETHGIEIVEDVVDIANIRNNVIQGDVSQMNFPYSKNYFDYILAGDVLEHLTDPEKVLNVLQDYLKPSGKFICSIPNIMNAEVIYNLLHGRFKYEDAGILDKTHMRFFTYDSSIELFQNCGFSVEKVKASIVKGTMTSDFSSFFDKLFEIDGVSDRGYFDAYQYLIRAKKDRQF